MPDPNLRAALVEVARQHVARGWLSVEDARRAHPDVTDWPTPRVARVDGCAFCAIVAGDAPARVVREWPDALAWLPRSGGCTPGHTLVVPRVHVADAGVDPDVTAAVMRRAAELAGVVESANIITSVGAAATQTVFHLHVHVVPRRVGDGLALPWTNQNGDSQ